MEYFLRISAYWQYNQYSYIWITNLVIINKGYYKHHRLYVRKQYVYIFQVFSLQFVNKFDFVFTAILKDQNHVLKIFKKSNNNNNNVTFWKKLKKINYHNFDEQRQTHFNDCKLLRTLIQMRYRKTSFNFGDIKYKIKLDYRERNWYFIFYNRYWQELQLCRDTLTM